MRQNFDISAQATLSQQKCALDSKNPCMICCHSPPVTAESRKDYTRSFWMSRSVNLANRWHQALIEVHNGLAVMPCANPLQRVEHSAASKLLLLIGGMIDDSVVRGNFSIYSCTFAQCAFQRRVRHAHQTEPRAQPFGPFKIVY